MNNQTVRPSNLNPWKSIWVQPGKAIRAAVAFTGDNYMHRMMMIFGNALMLAVNLPRWLLTGFHPVEIMLIFLVIGPIAGVMGTYILAAIVSAVGKWFGGVASRKEIQVAMAWAHLPTILALMAFSATLLICWFIAPPTPEEGLGLAGLAGTIVGIVAGLYVAITRTLIITEIHILALWEGILVFLISTITVLLPVIFFLFIYIIIFLRSLSGSAV